MPLRHRQLLPGTLQNLLYPPAKGEYTYFERADSKPFTDENGPLVKAAWAADAAMLSYAKYSVRPVDGKMPDQFAVDMPKDDLDQNFRRAGLAWEKIGDWEAHGTQGYFASGPKFAILAFRGTEAGDPADLESDLKIGLSQEADPYGGEACKVHVGFQEALDSVWNQVHGLVKAYRKQCPDNEICFTGHSLGAALALLAFSRLENENLSVYTFGCPRVGDAAFRKRTMSRTGKGVYRFVNNDDLVAHIPVEISFGLPFFGLHSLGLPYCQTPTECHRFDADGGLGLVDDDSAKDDLGKLEETVETVGRTLAALRLGMKQDLSSVPAPDSAVDHSPARYCFRLWDCV